MIITNDWLNNNIESQNGASLSSDQFQLLLKWFPDLFIDNGNGVQIVKGWKNKLLGRTISKEQTLLFFNKSFYKNTKKSIISNYIKFQIQNGKELCKLKYNKQPEHPHDHLVSLVGHIPGIDLINVLYKPDSTTIIQFSYTFDYEEQFFTLECAGSPINNTKPYQFYTYLYKGVKEEKSDKIYKDYTGKNIVECLELLKEKKKAVVIKKQKTVVYFPLNTTKKERKEKIAQIKERDKAIYDRVEKIFMEDFNNFNKKLKQQGEKEISLIEFAKICNVDILCAESLAGYKGIPKNTRK